MNHEEKKEKSNTYRIAGSADCFSTDSANSEHSKMQSSYYNLRDRVRDMLSNGVSTVRIFREIKNDKACTAIQKKRILEELHMK